MDNAPKQYKVVYTIVQRHKDQKKFWVRIGAAFSNRDGSLNVHLDAVPTNGQLQIRDHNAHDEDRSAGASFTDEEQAPRLLAG